LLKKAAEAKKGGFFSFLGNKEERYEKACELYN
jgi:hypothetical protein